MLELGWRNHPLKSLTCRCQKLATLPIQSSGFHLSFLEKLRYVIISMHEFHGQKISGSGMLCGKIMIFGKGSANMTPLIITYVDPTLWVNVLLSYAPTSCLPRVVWQQESDQGGYLFKSNGRFFKTQLFSTEQASSNRNRHITVRCPSSMLFAEPEKDRARRAKL